MPYLTMSQFHEGPVTRLCAKTRKTPVSGINTGSVSHLLLTDVAELNSEAAHIHKDRQTDSRLK